MSTEPEVNGTPNMPESRLEALERTCFVIMPFGKKDVGGEEVDFTAIYKDIFEPAINAARTPEDRPLIAARTDMDAFSSSIDQEMFEYIMYSRMAFADISGFNPNVFYEIGARHAAQESGTVLFRQMGHAIPFDIKSIKIFEYDHKPKAKAGESQAFIADVLTESLKRNRLDSPVRLALRAQWAGGDLAAPTESAPVTETPASTTPSVDLNAIVERFMRDAEEAIRLGDAELARTNYWAVLRLSPLNTIARMRLGHILKNQGQHYEALGEFTTVTKLTPDYGEAWKEKGVIEGLIARKIPKGDRPKWLADGLGSLEQATKLIPDDFDAWASLGGVQKNVHGDFSAASVAYAHSAEISNSHPYPLLNAIKLDAIANRKLNLKPFKEKMKGAEEFRLAQTRSDPPVDTPWSFFDAAEFRLYDGDKEGFIDNLKKGIDTCNASWQPKTNRDSLTAALVDTGTSLPGLKDGLALLSEAEVKLAGQEGG